MSFLGSSAAVSFEEKVPKCLEEALARLDRLGHRTKNIFILFRLQGMQQDEIATLYGMTRSDVERHLVIAMVELAKYLDSK